MGNWLFPFLITRRVTLKKRRRIKRSTCASITNFVENSSPRNIYLYSNFVCVTNNAPTHTHLIICYWRKSGYKIAELRFSLKNSLIFPDMNLKDCKSVIVQSVSFVTISCSFWLVPLNSFSADTFFFLI